MGRGGAHTCAASRPGYAQHLTESAAAWIAAHSSPKFKQKKTRGATGRPPKMPPKMRERVLAENARILKAHGIEPVDTIYTGGDRA